ncbi:Aste57867_21336 [Aphanomyces stellatus]|uniref:Aste57867_21336 protein n=1 Tax=Aphanomyces stellatus TaxID=120398 RepID=A0A485LHB0_9STRA|nr:hypothetical protein As57867_021267 [Aphanomyces stellatus]VFT98008.1 Aste57867_21336 [Aphanomyces stellatus]
MSSLPDCRRDAGGNVFTTTGCPVNASSACVLSPECHVLKQFETNPSFTDIAATAITFLESLPRNSINILFRRNGIKSVGDLSVDSLGTPSPATSLSLVEQDLTSFDNVRLPSSLQSLSLAGSPITSIRNTSFPTTLTSLDLSNLVLDTFDVDSSSYAVLSTLASFGQNYTSRVGHCARGVLQSIQQSAISLCVVPSFLGPDSSSSPSTTAAASLTITTRSDESSSPPARSTTITVLLICVLVVCLVVIAFLACMLRRRGLFPRESSFLQTPPKTTKRSSIAAAHDVRFDPAVASARLARSDLRCVRILTADGRAIVQFGYWKKDPVSIRQLQPKSAMASLDLFMDEVRTCLQVSHPHIVSCVGVAWSSATDMMIVSEHPDGGTLKAHMAQCGHTLEFKDTKWVLAHQIADALAYLHRHGICYRMLHADAVFLDADGHMKLANFGLHRRATGQGDAVALLWTHMTSIAPELLNGGDHSFESDVYALGILLCELDRGCSMQADFDMKGDDTLRGDVEKIVLGKFRPDLSAQCPEDIVNLIHACLQVNPAKRPKADAALQVLHEYRGVEV